MVYLGTRPVPPGKAPEIRLAGEGGRKGHFIDRHHNHLRCGIHVAWILTASSRGGILTVNDNANHDGLTGLKVMVIDD
jgi:hypothetical protein